MSETSEKKDELRDRLSDEQYEITQNKGTERPFTGKYVENKEDGTYSCVCCGAELFSSEHKYDSGSGWPSFCRSPVGDEWRDPTWIALIHSPGEPDKLAQISPRTDRNHFDRHRQLTRC